MPNPNNKTINLIDNLIYFFSIVFLLSLTNSIFVNQIGYYLSLILIAVRYYLTKEYPFAKTGLEAALVFYIIAEILATVFSVDPVHSFRILLKRFFLIPIVYTFIFSSYDYARAKKFVLIYLGASLITMIIYLWVSYNYFINNYYQLYESGPSLFQYPITTSELMSFSLVFIFAFLVNEKMKIKYRVIIFFLFIINLLALLATYKRTGWMGAAAGLLFVIVLGKKWKILIPTILLFIAGAFIEKNVSKVFIFDYRQNEIISKTDFNTKGRAYDIYSESPKEIFVSDFENGLLKYQNTNVVGKYDFGAPVVDFKKWNDSIYIANLIDTSFILLKKSIDGNFKNIDEFITPGLTSGWTIANGFVYVIDNDSGLTIFRNPNNLNDKFRLGKEAGRDNEKLFVDSSFVAICSKSKELRILRLKNFIPEEMIINQKLSGLEDLIYYGNHKVIIAGKNELKLYSITAHKLEFLSILNNIPGALPSTESNNKLFVPTTKGMLIELELPIQNQLIVKSTVKLGFIPKSISFNDGKLFVSQVKRSRLLSSVDPYIPSNFVRLALWRAGWLIFKDHPLFGVGDIDLAQLYKQYKRPYDKEIQGHLHNNYIHLLVTLGIFGFIAAMFLIVTIFKIHIKNYIILKNEPFAGSYSLGTNGVFLSFLVAGLSEWNFGNHQVITMVWFTLAISIAFVNYAIRKESKVLKK